jgi:hypothetical protein
MGGSVRHANWICMQKMSVMHLLHHDQKETEHAHCPHNNNNNNKSFMMMMMLLLCVGEQQ